LLDKEEYVSIKAEVLNGQRITKTFIKLNFEQLEKLEGFIFPKS